MTRTVLVSGASGLIGRALGAALLERGDRVIALSRDPGRARLDPRIDAQPWAAPARTPPPAAALANADAVVHLLGEPIAQRWTPTVRHAIRDSRVSSTRQLVDAIGRLPERERPAVLVSQSATGYYGPRGDETLDEHAAAGGDFLAEVVVAWEREALLARALIRVATPRTGVVLATGGGALRELVPFFRLGLGGPVAGGAQYVPWIHVADAVSGLLRLVDDPAIDGAVNLTAPRPVTNRELTRALGRVLHRPAILPVPAPLLRLRYGEMADVLTTGQRALPARLLEHGFEFAWPALEPALRDLLGR